MTSRSSAFLFLLLMTACARRCLCRIEIATLLARQAPLLAQHADASRCLDAVLLYCGKAERDAVVQ